MDIFAVHKPKNMTSHDVVNIVRKKTGVKRVGHGGTLDPLAEGVLVIAVGRENTKQLDTYVKGEKEYLATLKLGYISDTDDADGPIHEYISEKNRGKIPSTKRVPTKAQVQECIKKFIGNISQTPPIYSAIKIAGKPAYKYARRARSLLITHAQGVSLSSELPILKPRPVFIKRVILDHYSYPEVKIKVTCGPGVYIRSLARDIGEDLGTGAYMSSLIRTRVGKFDLESSLNLEVFESKN